MSDASDDEREHNNALQNGDADQELNEEMDDLFGDEVDEDAEAKA
jgi:hypothetical protein